MIRFLIATCGLVLCVIHSAAAQDTTGAPRLYSILSSAPRGALLRLRSVTGARIEGRVNTVDSTSITLNEGSPVVLAEVEHVWQRRSAWRTGGLIGGLALGAAGGLAGAGLWSLDERNPVVGAGVGGAVGGALGFLLGAAIGSAFNKWWHRYP